MPKLKIADEYVDVPDVIPGVAIRNLPAVRRNGDANGTPFLVDPATRGYDIIEADKQYQVRDGQELRFSPHTESGG